MELIISSTNLKIDDDNFIVGAGCSDGKGDAGLVDNHAYSVIECLNDVVSVTFLAFSQHHVVLSHL